MGLLRIVVLPQPLDEFEHDRVAPHPRGKTLEARKRFVRVSVFRNSAHVTVCAICIGPVGLDGNRVVTFLHDQPFCDFGTVAVELVRAVRRFTDQREACISDETQERSVIAARLVYAQRETAHRAELAKPACAATLESFCHLWSPAKPTGACCDEGGEHVWRARTEPRYGLLH